MRRTHRRCKMNAALHRDAQRAMPAARRCRDGRSTVGARGPTRRCVSSGVSRTATHHGEVKGDVNPEAPDEGHVHTNTGFSSASYSGALREAHARLTQVRTPLTPPQTSQAPTSCISPAQPLQTGSLPSGVSSGCLPLEGPPLGTVPGVPAAWSDHSRFPALLPSANAPRPPRNARRHARKTPLCVAATERRVATQVFQSVR